MPKKKTIPPPDDFSSEFMETESAKELPEQQVEAAGSDNTETPLAGPPEVDLGSGDVSGTADVEENELDAENTADAAETVPVSDEKAEDPEYDSILQELNSSTPAPLDSSGENALDALLLEGNVENAPPAEDETESADGETAPQPTAPPAPAGRRDSYILTVDAKDRTYGTGNGRYAPDTPITVRQWATMICRAFDKEDALSDPAGYGGDACINQGYADGWLNLTAMAAPDSRLCRYAIYESGFAAFDIALYSSQLYPEGETLSSQDNAFHAAVSFGLCEDTCAGTDIITRGEAADLLYALLTGEFTVAPPPILETIPLNNKEGVHLNSYLLELQKIPEPIRQAFAERGWQYTIDYEYLARLSEERNMNCIGATNYGSRQITVSSAGATVHEFGHFLDELMGFPSQTEGFYQEESGTAAALLRPYALTNEREYFADCFVYWLTYRDNSKKMAALCSAAPKTYAYLLALESQNWQPAA